MEDFKSPDEGGPDEIMPTPGDPAGKQNLEAQAMALLAEEKKQKKKRNTSRLGQFSPLNVRSYLYHVLIYGPRREKPVFWVSDKGRFGQREIQNSLLSYRD